METDPDLDGDWCGDGVMDVHLSRPGIRACLDRGRGEPCDPAQAMPGGLSKGGFRQSQFTNPIAQLAQEDREWIILAVCMMILQT